MESKEYSWAWVTADRLLAQGPCELHYAQVTANAANTSVTLYNGVDTNGEVIFTLKTLSGVSQQADLTKPVYCSQGLYVNVDANTLGIFVMWRKL